MGMDVCSVKGDAYFRNNVWWWRPLATYCCEVAPEITKACEYWQSNDGDGLDGEGSRQLAEVLEAKLASGEVRAYAERYTAKLENIADETCWLCKGSGERHDKVIDGTCNACGGKGKVRPSETHYPFNEENVEAFVKFLRECEHLDGFQIF